MHVFAFTLLLASAVASATDLSGNYTVSGKNPGGAAYSGKLSVRAEGVAYRLSWDTGSNLSGLAVPAGNMLVASFGAGCGVVAYQKASGGVLNGTWIAEGIGAGTEQAAPGAGVRGLAGDYLVKGKNANGAPYKGALAIATNGQQLRLSWKTGTNFEGFGFERDGVVAAAYGAPSCGLVVYKIAPDGSLDGAWKMLDGGFGTEVARR